jgi:hypothetical protein
MIILDKRQRDALDVIDKESSYEEGDFVVKRQLGVGDVTLSKLVELGLIEKGVSKRHSEVGWRPIKSEQNAVILARSIAQATQKKPRKPSKIKMLSSRVPVLEPRFKTKK